MKVLKLHLMVWTCAGLMVGSYLTGLTHGESKVKDVLYLVEHLEQRIGAIDVIEKGKTSGFTRAMVGGGK